MIMDLDSMKYAELRSLAKELGLKANMKADKLLKAIKQHYEQQNKAQEQDNCTVQDPPTAAPESEQALQDAVGHDEAASAVAFVNTRRGRGNCTKRKISSGAAEVDGPSELCNPPSSAVDKKKRKVSPDRDSEVTALEPQPADKDQQQPNSSEQNSLHAESEIPHTEKAPKMAKGGRIPRYQGLQQKSKTLLKPNTPNFKKLHEAQFNKMESIDSYVQRKKKQTETYKTPAKDLKKKSEQASMFSPGPVKKTPAEEKRQHTLPVASKIPSKKPAGKDYVPFRPTVLSTRRINVRFSEATLDNEFKRSLVKTPARISLSITSSTPKKTAADAGKPAMVKTSGFSAQKTPGPFVFTGNTSAVTTPGTQKKPAFDLKASLSRPLCYKPHKGKLKPFGEVKENAATNTSVSNPRQESYKKPKILSRDDRRNRQLETRKQKKESMLGARRGLVMM
ncbi:nucleolar and spindle-associated protein 1 isoform X1 [Cyprinodon tularosa]|uniref:nucleolar and spindle-associated protein 1 isoform X1 n=1 Tax=Cyprinodon tularosa TaxID=77115 RepID=UPI0018E272F7|nr:nucleolar and spindle-associated protein 1 isoform X1 [Cyprinodon tularosa]